MRAMLCGLALALGCGSAAGQEKPDELVRAAIVAAGGDTLAKYPAGRVVGKGVMHFAGGETPFTFEQAYHAPGRFRTMIRCEAKGQKWELLQVVDGAAAGQTINGRVSPLTDAGLRELQLAVLLNEVGQLSPLVADRRFTLKHDKQLKGPDAAGVIAQVRSYPDLRLAFDRKAGHLVRVAYRDPDPDTAKAVETETTFAEFKTVAGVTRPTRSVVTRDGKKVAELVVEKFTPLEKIDPAAFKLDE